MTPMKPRRWMKSALTAAARCTVAMPWARGPRREATIERRAAAMQPHALTARARRA